VNDDTGAYLGAIEGGVSRLWWQPPGGLPRVPIPALRERSPDGPAWGYEGSGPADAAKAILLHATASEQIAEAHHRLFMHAFLRPVDQLRPLTIPAREVRDWLASRHLPFVRAPEPERPPPLVTSGPAADCYSVSLDGTPILEIDLTAGTARDVLEARVAVRDQAELGGYCWDEVVAVTEPVDPVVRPRPERVTIDPLPFGGWAVQADGYDLAIVEPLEAPSGVRVAVYDRTAGSDFLAFDRAIRHGPLRRSQPVSERLRDFTGSPHVVAR
jgi:hypothetical protein